MRALRVGVVCDLREEGWYSMDLVADMLVECLPQVSGGSIQPTRLCPPMVRRWSRLPVVGRASRAHLGDRLTGRLWDYPRWLAARAADFDVFHIVDHSYAHLVRTLPHDRTVVTCHDLDALQAALPHSRRRLDPARLLAANILDGLRRAAHVACVSEATRAELAAAAAVPPDRISVVYEGVHPSCVPAATSVAQGFSPAGGTSVAPDPGIGRPRELLHVGSTIPRKRIDVLLEVFAGVRRELPDVRFVRVGGPLTAPQCALADRLGLTGAIAEVPFVERTQLADLYRRASLLLVPSEREGFGLPVVEAMACGTPVVASAIPALQEVGGCGAAYCAPGDVKGWVATVCGLLAEQNADPSNWQRRRRMAMTSAARFNWNAHAREMIDIYRRLA
jgi:glycosyltransferase involved in cell wall biosynthesis